MKQFLRLSLLWQVILLAFSAQGQNQMEIRSTTAPDPACPQVAYSYVCSPIQSNQNLSGCQYKWSIIGGRQFGTNDTAVTGSASAIQVVWNDVPPSSTTPARVKCTVTSCNTPALNTTGAVVKRVRVRSLSTTTPGTITLSGSSSGVVPFYSTTPLSLNVPFVLFPGLNNVIADAYEWTLPQGWSWQDGNTANPRVFTGSSANNAPILAVPAPGVGGVVRVRAVDFQCSNQANQTLSSKYADLVVKRPEPSIRITTAPFTLTCGDQTPITLTAVVDAQGCSIPATVTWNLPSGWTPSNSTGTTVTVMPTGVAPTTTQITAQAAFSCSPARQAVSTPLVFTYSPQVATPKFTRASNVCPGQTVRFTAFAPGATTYVWSVPKDFIPSSNNGPSIDITPRPEIYNGEYTISVLAKNDAYGCEQSAPASYTFRVGTGQASIVSDAIGPQSLSGQEVCANSLLHVFSRNEFGEMADFTWTATTGSFTGSQTDAYAELLTPGPGQNIDVAVRFQDECGTYKIAHAFFYTVDRMSDGTYCQGVIQPRMAPTKPALAAYPNPADATLVVEQLGGTVRLYNAQGRVVFEGQPKQGRVVIDTHQLPVGPYYLEQASGPQGRRARQTISINH